MKSCVPVGIEEAENVELTKLLQIETLLNVDSTLCDRWDNAGVIRKKEGEIFYNLLKSFKIRFPSKKTSNLYKTSEVSSFSSTLVVFLIPHTGKIHRETFSSASQNFVTRQVIFAETLRLKCEVGRSPFPSRDDIILINMTYRRVEICFASIMQASAKPCRVFSCFFSSVFRVYTNRIYGHRVMWW